jgi:hypothetical protein
VLCSGAKKEGGSVRRENKKKIGVVVKKGK